MKRQRAWNPRQAEPASRQSVNTARLLARLPSIIDDIRNKRNSSNIGQPQWLSF